MLGKWGVKVGDTLDVRDTSPSTSSAAPVDDPSRPI
jgi:hypothetical protein